jgi:hypothetical protein
MTALKGRRLRESIGAKRIKKPMLHDPQLSRRLNRLWLKFRRKFYAPGDFPLQSEAVVMAKLTKFEYLT